MEYERVLDMEQIMWCQKSRLQWLKEGDHNTKFVHKMASTWRMVNGIHGLRIGEIRVESAEEIKKHVEDYFCTLFEEDRPLRPKVG